MRRLSLAICDTG